ncbi:DUF3613 domain-containing protein [Zhongshania borealis]|uniref:DUF3613 domain-containing protein n=1 Tax=Zhongshania borealis TaxID=889488 RepID=A0ABP7WG00_9GAMM
MKTSTLCLALLVAAISMPTFAEQDIEYTPNTAQQTTTHRLLEQQRSGQNASTQEQYLSGPARTEIYKRYVKSFTHPIPERFSSDSFTEE